MQLFFGVTFIFVDNLSDPLKTRANLWLGTRLFHPVAGWSPSRRIISRLLTASLNASNRICVHFFMSVNTLSPPLYTVILFDRYYRFMEKVNLGSHMFQPPQFHHTFKPPFVVRLSRLKEKTPMAQRLHSTIVNYSLLFRHPFTWW